MWGWIIQNSGVFPPKNKTWGKTCLNCTRYHVIIWSGKLLGITPHILRMKLFISTIFLGKREHFTSNSAFKMEKKMNPPEMWDRQILWKSTFLGFLVQDILLLFGDLLAIFLSLFCWILFERHFLSFSLKLPARKGHKLRLQKVTSWNSPIFRCELPVSRKVKQRWFLCSVLVIEAHWDTTGGIFFATAPPSDYQSGMVSISTNTPGPAFPGLMYSMFPWIGSIGCDSQQILFPLHNQPWK